MSRTRVIELATISLEADDLIYLLLTDGTVRSVPEANTAETENAKVICCREEGQSSWRFR